jgi:phenylpyruvate tautomerase PptA (4-oxalocrotonate tautomerase family)
MPIFNIEVTDKTAQKLQQVVDELNQQTGDSLIGATKV